MHLRRLRGRQGRGCAQLGLPVLVLVGVVVEVGRGNDLAWERRHCGIVAEDADLDLAARHHLLGKYPFVVGEGVRDRVAQLRSRARLAHADRRTHVRRLHETWECELGLYAADELVDVLPVAEREGARGGETGTDEHPLHRDLVHRERGAEHARPDVGQSRELEHALRGAVFAVRAVQQRDHDVDIARPGHARHRYEIAFDCERSRERVPTLGQHLLSLAGEQPTTVSGDPDGDDVVLGGIERSGDGDRGGTRNVMLGRLSTEEEHDSSARLGHPCILAQITWSTARMPRPMMKRPPRPYASSIQPRACQT